MKYGFRDYRGGGRSSGRETIGRVAAGAVAAKVLEELEISVKAYAKAIAGIEISEDRFDLNEMNNNPFNIRRNNTKWQGLSVTQTDKSFFQFKTMAYGYRAAFKTLQTYIFNKYDTDKDGTANELEDVIMRWAPPCENNTDVYIATVEKRSGISRHTVLNRNNREQLIAVVAAMSFVENGVPANMDDVRKGWELI